MAAGQQFSQAAKSRIIDPATEAINKLIPDETAQSGAGKGKKRIKKARGHRPGQKKKRKKKQTDIFD